MKEINPEELAQFLSQNPESSVPRVATREECIELVRGALDHPAVGDIVQWRSDALRTHHNILVDDRVIVTMVLPMPMIGGLDNPPITMCIALAHDCGDPDCETNGHTLDAWVDGRRFKTVGTVLA